MKSENRKRSASRLALILISHQSPLRRPNAALRLICRRLQRALTFEVVLSVNIAAPDGLESRAKRLQEKGVRELSIFPYFLHDGFHVRVELPRRIRALRRRFPALRIRQCPHLGSHPALIDAVSELAVRGI